MFILVSSLYTTFCWSEFIQGIFYEAQYFFLKLYSSFFHNTTHARGHPQMTSHFRDGVERVNQKEVTNDRGEERRAFLVADIDNSIYYLINGLVASTEFKRKSSLWLVACVLVLIQQVWKTLCVVKYILEKRGFVGTFLWWPQFSLRKIKS